MKRSDWLEGKKCDKSQYYECSKCGEYLRHGSFHLHSDRVSVPEYEIVANPVVRWDQAFGRRLTPL